MTNKYQNLIYKNSIIPLSTVPFHIDVSCIERYFPDKFPMYLAIHKVTEASNSQKYTELHSHDTPEINIIIGDEGCLEYLIQLNEEVFTVQSNSSIWIPAGMQHSTNVIRGSGYYVAIRLQLG
jgi:hypothetical protein